MNALQCDGVIFCASKMFKMLKMLKMLKMFKNKRVNVENQLNLLKSSVYMLKIK